MPHYLYDNEHFFQGYSQLSRSIHGLEGAPEWGTMQALLPDIKGADILDLGCGFGWFCRWARQQGASSVVGIDVSENMLSRAKAMTEDSRITYVRGDLEEIVLQQGAYDMAYSSLALHYIVNLERLLKEMHASLKPGGSFVCSVEHPIYTASTGASWISHPDGTRTWPVDHYQMEGTRVTNWLAEGVVKQHRTLGTYLNLLIKHGFAITHVEDWGPSAEQLEAHPEWEEEMHRPTFLLLSARRN